MGRIFVSYAREDRQFAQRLARVLEEAGHEVWWDRRIDSGEEFSAEIEAELDKADVVLVAWSQLSVKSRWVRDEAAVGGDSGRLVPVSLDGSLPPMGFRQFQTLDLTGWKGGKRDRRTGELLRSIERRLEGKARAAARAPTSAGSSPLMRDWIKGKRLWAALAIAALIVAAAAGIAFMRSGKAEAEPASLAVLPFKNLAAGDPYFAEGVAEQISDQLAQEPQFKVAGRTSSALFKDAADLRDVGRRLHVAYVLEGSVRSAGQQVRVDVALVDTREGMQLWRQDFHGSLNDIFAIQDSIGQQVAAHVRKQLVRETVPDSLKTSGEVYSLSVTARSLMHQREPGKIDAAVALLRRAVKLDPSYAPALSRLALALSLQQAYGHENEGSPAVAQEKLGYAEKAAALAPQLAEAHAVLGLLLSSNADYDIGKIRRGQAELEKAVSLDANDAEYWYWLHYLRLNSLDFSGALDALRHTARIDPFFVNNEHLPPLAWDMGFHDEAERFLKDRIANHPDPFIREMARAQLAGLHSDLAAQYEYAKAARDMAAPDLRDIPETLMADVLLRLGLVDEAERYVPPKLVGLWRGKLTFWKGLPQEFPKAYDYWSFSAEEQHLLPRVLLKLGRSSELVQVYDHAFSSPDDMARRYSHLGFVLNAPLLAIALHRAARDREGVGILMLADGMCKDAMRPQHSPLSLRVQCSRVAALIGRREEAIRGLEQAVSQGWRPAEGEYPSVADEPAYAGLRNDVRVKRIDAVIAADMARQKHKLIGAGL